MGGVPNQNEYINQNKKQTNQNQKKRLRTPWGVPNQNQRNQNQKTQQNKQTRESIALGSPPRVPIFLGVLFSLVLFFLILVMGS